MKPSPTADLVLRGRCVLAGRIVPAEVAVHEGVIVSVDAAIDAGTKASDAAQVVELDDDEVLLPGLVDTHVHVNEPGRTHWEGFESATLAAAAGGVTTILDMPLNSIPPTIDVAALEVKREATKGKRHVDVGLWGGAVPSSLGTLRELHEAGVFGFKCFLADSGVEEFPALDNDQLDQALAEVASFGGLLVVHAEDARIIERAPHKRGPRYADFLASRPAAAEIAAVETVLELAAKRGARVHLLHLSSGDALGLIRDAKDNGVQVSVETCPHYLTLAAEEIGDGRTEYKCCPPIRNAKNRELLWDGLADGIIDCIVSDHSPTTPELKLLDTGDFGGAWGGISSLQLGLPLVWTEARRRGHDLAQVVRWMASRPADIAGVRGKGHIASGHDADFVIFAPDADFVVDVDDLHFKNPITPYAGRALWGVVRRTWSRGTCVFAHTDSAAVLPTGHLLSRGEV
ncbi:MAG: allantoinase AllB [Nocardioidaceae bacterium]|nr:allantoinase AllB [Nocardioidaceae bacterium]